MASEAHGANPYEADAMLQLYLRMHYATPAEVVTPGLEAFLPSCALEFPRRCAEECFDAVRESEALQGVSLRALDVGCAVGRSSFELARRCGAVVGVDFSHRFVDAANDLQRTGRVPYRILREGDLGEATEAVVDPALDRSRVTFQEGDACTLTAEAIGGRVHIVLAANLLCRLPKPRAFLDLLPALLHPGGIVALMSPYSWQADYTPKEDWLGGYVDAAGKEVWSFDTLKEVLGPRFDLLLAKDMPFLIPETGRKNQLTVSHCTVWRLR
jgi:putative 4-mercaptohistidine N1-methyltranferase